MAAQPSQYQLGDIYADLLSGGNYPEHLRGNGSDDSAKLTFLDRDIAAFTYMIHQNYPFTTKLTVSDRFYTTTEIEELERFYTVAKGSGPSGALATDTNHKFIAVSNNQGAELQPNNVLYIVGLFAHVDTEPLVAGQVIAGGGANRGPDLGYSTGGNPTKLRFSRSKGLDPASGRYFEDYEQVKVLSVGARDSAGLGYVLVELERCYMSPGEEDDGGRRLMPSFVYSTNGLHNTDAGGTGHTGSEHAVIRVGDRLLRGMPVAMEGTNAPDGVHKFPTRDVNFTQEFKYSWSKTKESDIVSKKVKKRTGFDAFEVQRYMTKRQANRDREYSNLLSRKLRTSVGGKEEFIAGGVRPFISKDSDHVIQFPGTAITWPALLDGGIKIFGLGGSDERTGFIGITMDAMLRKSFWNEHLFYNKEASEKFNIEVNTLYISGGRINLIVSQVMEENGYGNEILCLDMGNKDAFEPVTHEGWDYRVDNNNGAGIQEPGAQIYKEQLLGMFGLHRRYKKRHSIWDFQQAVAIGG